MKKILIIDGMTCQNCVNHTTEALEKIDGVTKVHVDLKTKTADVETNGDIADDLLIQAVKDEGYSVVSIS
ncbi:hypothetical protein MNBD_NITROSPINAE02-1880 [hydrothermal vent metagenome]|uniref:HMA domain-containing protein n=1 Tax=hydrothermal vent metagenome TaxID=652676 RepID=A0A3B1CU79_9ZZZZ